MITVLAKWLAEVEENQKQQKTHTLQEQWFPCKTFLLFNTLYCYAVELAIDSVNINKQFKLRN